MKNIKLKVLSKIFDYPSKHPSELDIKTAVVFVPRQLGDVMSVFPVIRAFQKAAIDNIVVVGKLYSKAVLLPLEKEGIALFFVAHERKYLSIVKVAREIRKKYKEVDLCVQTMQRDMTATLLFQGVLKAKSNLGAHVSELNLHCNECCVNAANMRGSHYPPPIVWSALMKDAGIAEVEGKYELVIPNDAVDDIAPDYGDYVLVNMDGSCQARCLNVEVAEKITDIAWDVFGKKIIITCAPCGEAKAQILSNSRAFVFLPDISRSIINAACLVKKASLVISPDTAIVHIASAFDRPVLGIYCELKNGWQPLSEISSVIETGQNINHLDLGQLRDNLLQLKEKMDLAAVKYTS